MAIVSVRFPDTGEHTYTTAVVSANGTTLTVRNTQNFNANDYIVIGEVGNENSELRQITTVDSDTQLTISALDFAHDIDTKVAVINYNQLQWASASTLTGSKTTQGSNITLSPDDSYVETNLSSVTSGYVFARFYNVQTATWSAYSPGIPVAGFGENSLRYIIDQSRLRTQELTENLITDNDLLDIAKECSDVIETIRKKWGFVQKTANIQLTAAVQSYYKPSDLAGLDAIERLILGINHKGLDYIDNKDFWDEMESIPKTILTVNASAGATSLNVRDTTAFGATGTLTIEADSGIKYTGKTNRTFTGVTGVSSAHTSNAEIFRTSDLDQPTKYSWWANHILFFPPPDKFYNAVTDYYQTIPRMTNVTIETIVPMPHLFVWYLMSEIFRLRGKTARADYYMKKFEVKLKLLANKERHKQIIRMQPATQYIHKSQKLDAAVELWREHGST